MPVASLPPIDHGRRLDRVVDSLDERPGIDGLLLTAPGSGTNSNIRWCLGFSGYTPWVVISRSTIAVAVDARYRDRLLAELQTAGIADRVDIVSGTSRSVLADRLVELARSVGRWGGCPAAIPHADWIRYASEFELHETSGLVEAERRAKDDAEIARIAAACAIADRALADVVPLMAGGPTVSPVSEFDIRTELEYRMRRLGADDASYPTIVASGPTNAARPHHGAGERIIAAGDLVVIDVGALVDGYHSDMTRTFVVGEPRPDQAELYEVVLAAQSAGLAAAGPDVPVAEIDAACRAVVDEAGLLEHYLHITGHGVGLDIHEDPFLGPGVDRRLGVGDVVTIEPGLYRDGLGGVRIEDLLVIEESGARRLTTSPKDDPCLPSRPTT